MKLDPAYSMKDCIRQTLIRVPYANGVTFSEVSTLTGKGDCEARIGQIYHSDSANKMNCFINPSYYKPGKCIFMIRLLSRKKLSTFAQNCTGIIGDLQYNIAIPLSLKNKVLLLLLQKNKLLQLFLNCLTIIYLIN